MKKLLFAALLALPLFAASARADGCGCGCWFPTRVEAGANVYLRFLGPNDCGTGQLGPWYLYYPLEAEFQTPAPTGYPYWPTPMTLPVRSAGAPRRPISSRRRSSPPPTACRRRATGDDNREIASP